jgi:N-succinyldiaminopimelate aminotransferase
MTAGPDVGSRTPADPLTHKLRGFGTTIFAEMSALAVATDSINLGQGFPDTDGPQAVLDAAIEAIRSGHNQYPPGPGIPALRAAIARHQQRFYGLDHDPDGEVLVTAGATEALAGTLLGMLDTGDEVVVFEPMYDSYQACIALAGAHAVPVLLQPEHGGRYGFDTDELRAAISPRTRLILLNTPHNPTGKVFDADELTVIADLAIEHDLIVVTDEVYEHLVFPGAVHIPMATLPGMAERTLTISSGGKTFNTTGWKVGWMCGPRPLVTAARTAKQFLTYVNAGPFQPAIAIGLDLGDDFYRAIAADLTTKRDHLVSGLQAAGFVTHVPEATYFTTVDIRPVDPTGDGMSFCRTLPERCGVVAVPNEVFYARPEHGRHLVRFACCKRLEVLDEAAARLGSLAKR